ncbi:PREDICTED: c-C motif chemokine 25 [Chrysochloris asiatica]|uniref:C-C motif chemokine 25 n=1 Tax=Chrysochloris asiatica TaxID=185453 RepID=A0A9B0TWH8_CHRAS|nr:PREDICTED: c-C motif chemokine 25 [Chrysochloris asiatica]
MNQWLLACLVIGLVGAWVPAVNTQGAFEDCCLAYNPYHRVRPSLIQRAQSYQLQEASGSCNLPAVIFFLPRRQKKVCGDPQAKWVQKIMKLLDARNKSLLKTHGGIRKTSQDVCLQPSLRQLLGELSSPFSLTRTVETSFFLHLQTSSSEPQMRLNGPLALSGQVSAHGKNLLGEGFNPK